MELFKNKRGKIEMKLDTTEDRISAFMMRKIDESALQAPDHKIMRRWAKIWSLQVNGHSPDQAVKTLYRIMKRAGEEVSERTLWNDLKHATRIWGSLPDVSYQSSLILLREYAMKVFKLATEDRDLKEMNRAIAELREISKELNLVSAIDDGNERVTSNFILIINQADGGQMTYDLTDVEVLPDDISGKIIEAARDRQQSTDSFMEIVEQGGVIDEE